MTNKVRTSYQPTEIDRAIDPVTGYTVVRFDNPEGDALAEESRKRNLRIRSGELRAGNLAIMGIDPEYRLGNERRHDGQFKRSILPASGSNKHF